MTTVLTPPASSHSRNNRGTGDWNFSVPLADSDEPAFHQTPGNLYTPPTDSLPKNGSPSNGLYQQPYQPDGQSDENHEYRNGNAGQGWLDPPRPPMIRQDSSQSHQTDGGDSLFDLYGVRSSMISQDERGHDRGLGLDTDGPYDDDGRRYSDYDTNDKWIDSDKLARIEDPGSSKWVDRDKLAQIEGREAVDYLYDRENSRWIHRDRLEIIEIQELQQVGLLKGPSKPAQSAQTEEESKKRMSSPTSDDGRGYASGSSEERNGEGAGAAPRTKYRRATSSSRIPVPGGSRIPVPQQKKAPDSPEKGMRRRSRSVGSAILLDERTASPTKMSPMKAQKSATVNGKVKNYTTPVPPAARRTSHNNSRVGSMAKSRTRSNPQLGNGKSSNNLGGSLNSRAPEGPPPWALTGYKPDPSLPPDQQIIPTLARKMQQEQWEREGLPASAYDRNLRPLMVNDGSEPRVQKHEEQQPEVDLVQDALDEQWPLSPKQPSYLEPEPEPEPEPRVSEEQPQRDAGYRAMPRISKTEVKSAPPITHQAPGLTMQVPVVEDEKEEKEKKFCCCTIM